MTLKNSKSVAVLLLCAAICLCACQKEAKIKPVIANSEKSKTQATTVQVTAESEYSLQKNEN